jgi:hypothetical protein
MSLNDLPCLSPFLPDGRHRYSRGVLRRRIGRSTSVVRPKARTRLMAAESMAAYVPPGFVLFSRGGTLMARPFDPDRLEFTGDPAAIAEGLELGQLGRGQFGVSGEGTLIYMRRGTVGPNRQLLWMDRMGNREPFGAPFRAFRLRLSPDGKRVAFPEPSGASGPNTAAADLWIYDTGLDVRTKLTSDPTINHWPVWSPDGTRLVSIQAGIRTSKAMRCKKSANGATPERLPERGLGWTELDWSRDGSSCSRPRRPRAGGRTTFGCCHIPVSENHFHISRLRSMNLKHRSRRTAVGSPTRRMNPGRIKCSCNPSRTRPRTGGRFLLRESHPMEW